MPASSLLPRFLIGGAPRSGTTFLCHALERHPEIYLAKPYVPEPKVFMQCASAAEYRQRYAELFAASAGKRVLGEKCSYYLESAEACARIRAHLPGVKLLFLVREPVARAYSNYLWSRKNGLEALPFADAVRQEGRRPDPLPAEQAYARPFAYLERGNYGRFAERYYSAFGRERVAFFLYEDIVRRPAPLLSDIQQFLGVKPVEFTQLDPGIINSARDQGPPLTPALAGELRARLTPAVRRFASITGLDIGAWGYDAA